MLTDELIKGYRKSQAVPNAMMKLDISKSYDSIQWSIIIGIMAVMRFPKTFVAWVYMCISTASYSLIYNGTTHGYFEGLKEELVAFFGLQYLNKEMKYLGLPLCTSRVTMAICLPHYEKITNIMNCWSTRMLSQAGRPALIKSVCFSMMVYWARTFILPAKLLRMVRSAMMNFFWSGIVHTRKLVPISFSKI